MVRCLGMKIVAFMALLKSLDEELLVLSKLGKVFHISYGHMSRFDERYKVREKIWAITGFLGSKLNKEAQRVKSDMSGSGGGRGGMPDPSAPLFDDVFGVPPDEGGSGGRRGGNNNNRGYDDGRPPAFNPYGNSYGRGR